MEGSSKTRKLAHLYLMDKEHDLYTTTIARLCQVFFMLFLFFSKSPPETIEDEN
jgi:hypothetical protein